MVTRLNTLSLQLPRPRELWASLRQLAYPLEFRISAPSWTDHELDLFEKLADLLELPPTGNATDHDRLFANLGTRLWRVRRQLFDERRQSAKEGLRHPFNQVEAMLDALAVAGLVIKDHTGEHWIDGQEIDVAAFQPEPGLHREVVIDTIRPSIFYDHRHIQRGQVIVGTPDKGEIAAWETSAADRAAGRPSPGTNGPHRCGNESNRKA